MTNFRKTILMAAVTAGAVTASAGAAHAGSTPAAGRAEGATVLALLCEAKGGSSVATPYTIGRCQEARSRSGFEIERIVCEGLLEGHFSTAPSFGRPNRTTWACFDPAPPAG